MLKFVPNKLNDDGTVERYKVFRNGKELRLQPNISGLHGTSRVGMFYEDNYWCLMIAKEAIDYVNFDAKKKLTAKEENQLFNFYRYGKANPTKANKLVKKIEETERNLQGLKEQLKKELK